MSTVYLDTGTIIELRDIGFDALPSDHHYVIPDYIWEYELDPAIRNEISNWASGSNVGFETKDVRNLIDFTDPVVASNYNIDVVTDANGDFTRFASGSQLGDVVFFIPWRTR